MIWIKHCMQSYIYIVWKHTSIHANVMGISHTVVTLLASNGKWYQYVGMCDIYIVIGIIAGVQYPSGHMEECTIDQYNLGEMEGILPEADG